MRLCGAQRKAECYSNIDCLTRSARRCTELRFRSFAEVCKIARERDYRSTGRKLQAGIEQSWPTITPPVVPSASVDKDISTATRRLDCSDVDLLHLHHRVKGALSGSAIGIGDRFN